MSCVYEAIIAKAAKVGISPLDAKKLFDIPLNKKTFRPGGIREMVAIAFPMLISFACDTVMTFTDRVFLSRLGPVQMNAAMGGGLCYFVVMSFFMGLVGYATALVAQYYGAEQKSNCGKVLFQVALILLVACPLLIVLRPFFYMIMSNIDIASDQLILQTKYFNILVLGAFLALGRHALSSFFSGIGRTNIVMVSSFMAMIINCALNYCLIFGRFGFPALGIEGAAIGTIVSGGCGFIILLIEYFRPKIVHEFSVFQGMTFNKEMFFKFIRFGYPAGLEFALNVFAFSGFVILFQAQGPVAATAATIVINWDMVTFVPLMGVEVGVTSLVGRYVGAQELNTVHLTIKSGVKLGLIYSGFLFVLFLFFPQPLAHVFHPEAASLVFQKALPLSISMLRLISLYVLAQVFFIVYVGALRGAGDTLGAMVISVAIHWFIFFSALVGFKWLQFSVFTVWCIVVFAFMAFSPIAYLYFKRGKWKEIQIVKPLTPHQDINIV